MKKLLISLIALFSMMAVVPSGAGLNDGLVAYYPFNGNAIDASGHGYHGVVHGATPTQDRSGVQGRAFNFDGVNDYIDLGTALDVPSWTDYTLSVWFLHDGGGAWSCGPYVGYGHKIIDKTVWFHDFYLTICKERPEHENYAQGALQFNTYENTGEGLISPEKDYRDNAWHHAVITKEDSVGKLWVDGVLMDVTGSLKTVFSWGKLLVAYSESGDYLQRRFFSGKIDDIRIYNRALSKDEVMTLGMVNGFSQYIDMAALNDVNANGHDEIIALRATKSGVPQVVTKDTGTNKAIKYTMFFTADWTPVSLAAIDANRDGVEDIAVLAVNRNSGEIKVQIRDGRTAWNISSISFFTVGWQAKGLRAVDGNADGLADIAVLAVNKADHSVVTVIKDVQTKKKIATVPFGK